MLDTTYLQSIAYEDKQALRKYHLGCAGMIIVIIQNHSIHLDQVLMCIKPAMPQLVWLKRRRA